MSGRNGREPGGCRAARRRVGEFGSLDGAIARLKVVMALSLRLIALLLYLNCSSIVDMLLAPSVVPMAMMGGIFTLFLTGTPFSVSAAIGFIALSGVSVMESVILLAYFNRLIQAGWADRTEAVMRACAIGLRPVPMTCVAACVGLLPAAVSTGFGSHVRRLPL